LTFHSGLGIVFVLRQKTTAGIGIPETIGLGAHHKDAGAFFAPSHTLMAELYAGFFGSAGFPFVR